MKMEPLMLHHQHSALGGSDKSVWVSEGETRPCIVLVSEADCPPFQLPDKQPDDECVSGGPADNL